MKVSLCTTVKNRLHHIKETLPYNIEVNQDPNVDLILIDYWSTDGLEEWVKENHSLDIEKGKLKYYRLAEPIEVFILTHAINIGFRAAEGDIVCNVDADNFTGREFGTYLNDFFKDKTKLIAESRSGYGLSGRKAFRRDEFINILGGYDEDMRYGWGYDEWDIKARAEKFGFAVLSINPELEGSYIHHEDDERCKNNILKPGMKIKVKADKELSNLWAPHLLHKRIGKLKMKFGIYKANMYRRWGHARVIKNFKIPMEIA
jgi:glycosyltransferase involved in cell wall biosynthesis